MCWPSVTSTQVTLCLQAPHTHAHGSGSGSGSAARVRWKRGAAKAILAQALLSRPHDGPGAAQVRQRVGHAAWMIKE